MGESIEDNASPSIKEYFNELFNYALYLGMTPSQFWEEDTDLILNYVKAEEMRQKTRTQEINFMSWLSGSYVLKAVSVCLSNKNKYPNRPIPLTEEEIEERNNDSLLKLKEELIAEAKKGM